MTEGTRRKHLSELTVDDIVTKHRDELRYELLTHDDFSNLNMTMTTERKSMMGVDTAFVYKALEPKAGKETILVISKFHIDLLKEDRIVLPYAIEGIDFKNKALISRKGISYVNYKQLFIKNDPHFIVNICAEMHRERKGEYFGTPRPAPLKE